MYMKRQPIGRLLEEWYGHERAQSEKLRYLPPARPLSEVVATVAKRALPPECLLFAQIKESWLQIAGPDIAGRTSPYSLDGSRLILEISHPAWLTHFRSPQIKRALLQKINKTLGREFCTDLVFVPAGRAMPGETEASS